MKYIFTYTVIIILLISCKKTDCDLIGDYKIYKPSYTERIYRYFKYDGSIIGSKLKLKKDSTFELTNCSMYIKGKWTNNSDSLFLKIENKRFRIDSLNNSQKWKKSLEIGIGNYSYKIDGKFLEKKNKSSLGKVYYEKLEKIEQ